MLYVKVPKSLFVERKFSSTFTC